MASASNNFLISLVVVVAAAALASGASAQLSSTFYDTSCPNALSTIRTAVNAAVAQEARMGASLLRLHFHDCFVQASRCRSQSMHNPYCLPILFQLVLL
jgi:peroxidase